MNIGLDEIFYILNVISTLIFLFLVFKAYREAKQPFSIERFFGYVIYELKKGVSTVVGYIHFSIMAGIVLTTFYLVLGPLIFDTPFWAALITISIPFVGGLFAGLIWRFIVFSRSQRIHENLKLKSDFKKDSLVLQTITTISIALSLSNLVLAWFPELFMLNSSLFIIRNVFASKYAKPFVNTIMNFDRPISYLKAPFNLKDLLEGKIKDEDIKIGVKSLNELDMRESLSLKSCVESGVCDKMCPATTVGRPLSPRVIIRKLSLLMENKPANANPLEVVDKNELWACTTCGACTSSCPIGVRHFEIIIDLRRTLTEAGMIDRKKTELFSSVSKYGNTSGLSNRNRLNWLTDLGVKTVDQNQNYKYLLWVGCVNSFDERLRKIVEALVAILKNVGRLDEIAILGDDETCCGNPVRMLGEEGLYQEIALRNIELFEKHHINSILTTCPHCCNSFKNDYPAHGMKNIKVIHQVELLNMLFEDDSLKLKATNETLAIHDSCYLIRYNKITDMLERPLGRIGELKRPKNHGENTFCCGGGGANYFYEFPDEKRISHERLEQLMELEPKTIVTFCPYCHVMLLDAVQDKELGDIDVLDAAQIIHRALK